MRDHGAVRDPASAPIHFTDELLERLAAALDVPDVVAALLIGSHARGRATQASDLDLAVWLDPTLSPAQRWDLCLRLLDRVTSIARSDAVDLVVLNDAPPLLQHRALRDGRRILERERTQRIRLDVRAMLEYLDTQPLRDELARGLRHRVEEDRFGR